jgi:hypothetical protein
LVAMCGSGGSGRVEALVVACVILTTSDARFRTECMKGDTAAGMEAERNRRRCVCQGV